MFKKWTKEEVGSITKLKSSVERGIRKSIEEQYPMLGESLEDIIPKKVPLVVAKCPGQVKIYISNNEPKFFTIHDGPFYPHLKVLHQYPQMLPQFQVDRGAVKFILSGANIMCRGLTSPGAKLDMSVDKDKIVAIMVEGKEDAIGVGLTKMSAKEIKELNTGIGVDNIHCLDDFLWHHVFN
ncbi:hypothetical protein FDP41_002460 [Naegleria fowleri]|uniref:PUA domain-containing protein n=1 Tax=Naegleria fowleri TaxID=5763 RepID=A0A6A5BYJ2_NAEFO|nr:uncharacterized protein FDP41_002460 [Naegleria fowleri]KAF0978640.1 hypothetical protein FDP41_002460 [Naegleria fowleri]